MAVKQTSTKHDTFAALAMFIFILALIGLVIFGIIRLGSFIFEQIDNGIHQGQSEEYVQKA
jgi:flagellar biogenesis protein FliO